MILTYKEKIEIIQDKERLFEYQKRYMLPTVEACIDFILNWVDTFDPRNEMDKVLPFHLFDKQIEFIRWLWQRYKNQEDGVVDKCRDIGATWCFIAFSMWMLLFQKNISIALFTFKATECDRSGDISTLFGKCDFILEKLPKMFIENVISKNMHIRNEALNSDIVGASGDNPLRSNRRSIIFKDESAFYEQAEKIDAAVSESSNCKIDVSTHAGTDTVFYNKVTSGAIPVFTFDWYDNPKHTQEWFDKKKAKALAEGTFHIFQREILRNAQASIASVLIPSEWVNTSKTCTVELRGKKIVTLDVADEGFDTNALCVIDGNVPVDLDEWQTDDPNISARKVFYKALEFDADEIRYDCIGVGAGVKAGFNNILEELNKRQSELELLIEKTYNNEEHKTALQNEFNRNAKALKIKIIGWAASGAVLRPDDCDYGDKNDNDKTNGELFENAKSQAYFKIRNEFLQTYYQSNNQQHNPDKLICFKHIQEHRLFNKFLNEISQPIQKLSARGKILIDKKGSGKSPNLAEAWLIGRAEIEFNLSIWDV
jgi:hypothetical protein